MTLDQQDQAGCLIGKDYPRPVVEHATAYREARQKLAAFRNRAETRQEAKAVFLKHGSRKEDAIPFKNRQLPQRRTALAHLRCQGNLTGLRSL